MRVPLLTVSLLLASTLGAQGVPQAVYVDPPHDA